MKFDTSKLRRGIRRSAQETRRAKEQVVTRAARGFIRVIVTITPPGSQGVTGSAARKHGEAVITADLHRIFKPLSGAALAAIHDFQGRRSEQQFGHKGAAPLGIVAEEILSRGQMAAWHQSRRTKNGRVMKIDRTAVTGLRKRDLRGLDTGLVARADFESYLRIVLATVGLLAAGWNAAAEVLGVPVPAWIRRHGNARGIIRVIISATTFRIELANAVQFVDNVPGFERRVARAAGYQVAAMHREADFLQAKQHSQKL